MKLLVELPDGVKTGDGRGIAGAISGHLANAFNLKEGPAVTPLPNSIIVVLKTNCSPVLNEVFSNVANVKVVFLDEDTEGANENVLTVEGEEVWVGTFAAEENVLRVADVAVELICQGVTP